MGQVAQTHSRSTLLDAHPKWCRDGRSGSTQGPGHEGRSPVSDGPYQDLLDIQIVGTHKLRHETRILHHRWAQTLDDQAALGAVLKGLFVHEYAPPATRSASRRVERSRSVLPSPRFNW